jgi:hypothetical protein
MASRNSLILREDLARKRLMASFEAARKAGVEIPEPSFSKPLPVRTVEELEYFADVAQLLVNQIQGGKPADAEPQVEPEPQASQDGEAVEDTESAQSVEDAPEGTPEAKEAEPEPESVPTPKRSHAPSPQRKPKAKAPAKRKGQ